LKVVGSERVTQDGRIPFNEEGEVRRRTDVLQEEERRKKEGGEEENTYNLRRPCLERKPFVI
jgi:hypothetical protein